MGAINEQKWNGLGRWLAICLSAILLGCGILGCGRNEQLPVAGSIQVDGKPVDKGLVTFETSEPSQSAVGARIDNGRFATAKGHGVLPGTYQVRVKALRKTGRRVFDRQAGKEVEQLVSIPVGQAEVSVTIDRENSQQIELNVAAAN